MRYVRYDLPDTSGAVRLVFLYVFVCHRAWPRHEVVRQLVKAIVSVVLGLEINEMPAILYVVALPDVQDEKTSQKREWGTFGPFDE